MLRKSLKWCVLAAVMVVGCALKPEFVRFYAPTDLRGTLCGDDAASSQACIRIAADIVNPETKQEILSAEHVILFEKGPPVVSLAEGTISEMSLPEPLLGPKTPQQNFLRVRITKMSENVDFASLRRHILSGDTYVVASVRAGPPGYWFPVTFDTTAAQIEAPADGGTCCLPQQSVFQVTVDPAKTRLDLSDTSQLRLTLGATAKSDFDASQCVASDFKIQWASEKEPEVVLAGSANFEVANGAATIDPLNLVWKYPSPLRALLDQIAADKKAKTAKVLFHVSCEKDLTGHQVNLPNQWLPLASLLPDTDLPKESVKLPNGAGMRPMFDEAMFFSSLADIVKSATMSGGKYVGPDITVKLTNIFPGTVSLNDLDFHVHGVITKADVKAHGGDATSGAIPTKCQIHARPVSKDPASITTGDSQTFKLRVVSKEAAGSATDRETDVTDCPKQEMGGNGLSSIGHFELSLTVKADLIKSIPLRLSANINTGKLEMIPETTNAHP